MSDEILNPQEVIENGNSQTNDGQETNADANAQETNDVEQENANAETQAHEIEHDDKVPLATLLEEKKRRKEIEAELRKFREDKTQADLKKRYLEMGWPEDSATDMANNAYRVQQMAEKFEAIDKDNEIAELSRTNTYFADALNYKKEIRVLMKDKNLTAEEAYHIVRGPSRTRELNVDIEQKTMLKRREEATPRTVPNASASSPKNPYPLDENDKRALDGLMKAQPNANWTPEKYYKSMKQ